MKKLILIISLIAVFAVTETKAQTSLQWLVEENHYTDDAGDSISIYLWTVVPVADIKNTTQKFTLQMKKNGKELYKWRFTPTMNLDSTVTMYGQTRTYLGWLSQFMTINVASLKLYAEEVFKQKIDSTGQYIKFD